MSLPINVSKQETDDDHHFNLHQLTLDVPEAILEKLPAFKPKAYSLHRGMNSGQPIKRKFMEYIYISSINSMRGITGQSMNLCRVVDIVDNAFLISNLLTINISNIGCLKIIFPL